MNIYAFDLDKYESVITCKVRSFEEAHEALWFAAKMHPDARVLALIDDQDACHRPWVWEGVFRDLPAPIVRVFWRVHVQDLLCEYSGKFGVQSLSLAKDAASKWRARGRGMVAKITRVTVRRRRVSA